MLTESLKLGDQSISVTKECWRSKWKKRKKGEKEKVEKRKKKKEGKNEIHKNMEKGDGGL